MRGRFMSDKRKKRYYWLKLKENFFEEDTITWLEEQPNGKEYCLIYLKLCLKSLKTNGLLVRNVGNMMIPYEPESLAKLTNSTADTIKVAMDLFQKIGLIQMMDSGEIHLNQLDELVGSETESAVQKRLERTKKGIVAIQNDKGATMSQKCRTEYRERDKNILSSQTRKKRVYDPASNYYQLAERLFKQICQNQEIKEPNLQRWADDIRKMIEIDKRTEDQVSRMIDWSQKHVFWSANILSARKLREKYDTMAAQANREYKQTHQQSVPPLEYNLDEVEKAYEQ